MRLTGIKFSFALSALFLMILAGCVPITAPESSSPDASGTESAGETTEHIVYVGPELVNCEGVAPQKCMLVKEDPDGEYSLFYDQIDGFEYEDGYEYVLRVQAEEIPNPPADGSSIKWTLVEVMDKQPVAASPPLEGTLWSLQSYVDADGNMVDALPDSPATIQFENGEVRGTSGCNNHFGTYTTDGDQISIGEVGGMTMMACPGPMADQENNYFAALPQAATYQISGDQLQISDADGNVILVYTAVEPTSLTETQWVVTGYNNGRGGVVSVLADTELLALFHEDGTLTGSGGCNTFNTSYTVDGNNIQIGPIAVTMMMCAEPEGILEQETEYLAALESAATYMIEGDTLDLRTAEDSRAVSLRAQ